MTGSCARPKGEAQPDINAEPLMRETERVLIWPIEQIVDTPERGHAVAEII